eukprot:gene14044-29891_t
MVAISNDAKSIILDMALRSAGPLFFVGMQLAAINTAYSIWIGRSVGKLSPLPFVSLVINCVVWSIYGFLKSDMTVLLPNFSGLIVGVGCSLVYHKFCISPPLKLYSIGLGIVFIALYFAANNNSKNVGLIGCVLGLVVMGSPLATLRTVLTEQSTAALPFWTSLSGWMNSLSWLAYGVFIAKDPIIYVPNILGFLLASIQLSLFIIFGMPPQSKLP